MEITLKLVFAHQYLANSRQRYRHVLCRMGKSKFVLWMPVPRTHVDESTTHQAGQEEVQSSACT